MANLQAGEMRMAEEHDVIVYGVCVKEGALGCL
jgi:hypothetical protein